MRRLITLCAGAVLILAAGSAHADMTIDFDSLANHELIDNQYILGFGADFNSLARISAYPNPSYYPTHSYPNVIENQNLNYERCNIRIDAVGPDKWLMAGGYVTGAAKVTLTAYDSSGPVGIPSFTDGANTADYGLDKPNKFLSVSAANINYVIFSIEDYNIFTVDDFSINPVPVPAAVLLGMLGLGVAGIKLRKFS